MNIKKSFKQVSVYSLIVSLFFSSSIYFYLFQDINISRRGLVLWILMFIVFYFGFAILEQTKIIQNWKSFGKSIKLLSILLTPVIGYLIISFTNFELPNAVLLLPRQHITIQTSQVSNPLSSGNVIEIDGITNGDQWISLKSLSVNGDFELSDVSIILTDYLAEINYTQRVVDQLGINFVGRTDGGIAKVISNGEEKEIDLFSEVPQTKLITLNFPKSILYTFFLFSLFSLSIGFLVFFLILIIFYPKISEIFNRIENTEEGAISLVGLLISTCCSIFIHIFMEWLFQITKPSFMNYYGFSERIIILLSCFSVISVLVIILICLLYRIFSFLGRKRLNKQIIGILTIIPTMILSIALLLLVDNFTYTLFKFGIVSTEGFSRAIYGLFFLSLMALSYSPLLKITNSISQIKQKKLVGISIFSFISLSFLVTIIMGGNSTNFRGRGAINQDGDSSNFPDIIYITGDGVNARNMSLYGYERDTTPGLVELSHSSLVAENAFTNSGATTGSLLAVFTGKYPSETRVLYPPDILQGKNTFENLIAILRTNGYFSAQIAIPHFVDAYVQNLYGFNIVNGRSIEKNHVSQYIPQDTYYFINLIKNRIVDRLNHIFYIENMANAFEIVSSTAQVFDDREKIEELTRILNDTAQPLFIHIHLIRTHGEFFGPIERIFSKGETQKEPWSVDFYDDSIHEFDALVGSFIDELGNTNKLDNTIFIIGSDHGMKWSAIERIPLLIRFPNGDHAGLIKRNVQNIDIAPTILDYLNIDIPSWMEGTSLIEEDTQTQVPIFSCNIYDPDARNFFPPFYQFGSINIIYCQNWFNLNLRTNDFTSGIINGYENPCPDENILSNEKAFEYMKNHLQDKGFDTSSLIFKETQQINK